MNQLETTISQQLTELKAHEGMSTFYVVERTVNLHMSSDIKSKIITKLYPNMKVRVIQRASKWISIEYFDYIKNAYISGWVCKKYLVILNTNRSR
jgi:hypothetical protein